MQHGLEAWSCINDTLIDQVCSQAGGSNQGFFPGQKIKHDTVWGPATAGIDAKRLQLVKGTIVTAVQNPVICSAPAV